MEAQPGRWPVLGKVKRGGPTVLMRLPDLGLRGALQTGWMN
jgi:hypothetical protein